MSSFEIPEKCRDCPVGKMYLEDLTQLEQRKQELIVVSNNIMDGVPASARPAMAQTIKEILAIPGVSADIDPEDVISQLEQSTRQALGEDLGDVMDTIDSFLESWRRLTLGCLGPLAMRAVKNGTEFTVTICTNHDLYNSGPSIFPTKIKSTKK